MGSLPVIIGSLGTLFVYAVIAAGAMKLFQIATDVGEMKEILKDIKRNSEELASPPGRTTPQSPEALLRALSAESYSSDPQVESEK